MRVVVNSETIRNLFFQILITKWKMPEFFARDLAYEVEKIIKEYESTDVVRTDNIDERYPDDWLLECNKCGNWEQVVNNRPSSFTVVEGLTLSKQFLRDLVKVITDTIIVLEDEGYDMSDVEFELNDVCSEYADDAGNGFAKFRKMLEED